jgi:uroporphyrinogen III methyltransferase / synthase
LRMADGIVFLVGAGPGDPGLITLRGVECLRMAEVVVHDRLVNHALLAYAPSAEWIDVGKQPDHHLVPQERINGLLVEHARSGKVVVRLKGGDPFVFGRGGEEALALVEAGLPFEIVPGVSSAVAAPAYAGIPVTHRGLACSAAIITGHRADCTEDPESDWTRAARGCDTLVFLMGVRNLPRIVERVLAGGRSLHTPAALISQATCLNQEIVTGTLENIVERSAAISPPAVIVIGEVAGLHEKLAWYRRSPARPLAGLCVLNTRPARAGASPLDSYSDEFSRRLSDLGSLVLELPTIQVVAAPDPGPMLAAVENLASGAVDYDWLAFTSAYGVVRFFEALLAGGADCRACAGLKLAAVGQVTARSLRPYGLLADFTPSKADAAHLACELPDPAGKRILMPRSGVASDEAVAILHERGAQVEPVVAYTVEPVPFNPALHKILLQGEYDTATFFSPSALAGLAQLACDRPLETLLEGKLIACAGETTARAARLHGLQVDLIADDPSVEGMLEALLKWRGR